jgi:type VI secretion system protein
MDCDMKLMLKAISNMGDEIDTITLYQESATIGRNSGNTLVLDDPKRYISGQHAVIDYQNPDYFVTDTSTNGVIVNNATQPLGKGNRVKLSDGDQLHIGDYSLEVAIDLEQQAIDSSSEPVKNEVFDFADDPFAELEQDPVQEMIDENQWKTSADWKEGQPNVFDLDSKREDSKSEVVPPPAFKEAFQPYETEKSEQKADLTDDMFGENWFTKGAEEDDDIAAEPLFSETDFPEKDVSIDKSEIKPAIPQADKSFIQAETAVENSSKPSNARDAQTELLVNNFLRGAGLENSGINETLSPESFYIIGKILKSSVQGTMDVLIGRAKIKNEMHLDVTMIRSKENNPVKFSVTAEEALKKLLAPQDAGYLPAEEAIEEAFDDIRAHQFSVIAGMQTALLEVLKRFDPEKLEQRLQRQNPISSSIPVVKQAKLWDTFEQLYKDIEHEAADNFYHLFGQAFAESYEQQIIKLKNAKKESPF